MALNKITLLNELRKFGDPQYSGFTGWPSSLSDSADKWAEALGLYASTILPVSLGLTQAKSDFKTQFLLITSGTAPVQLPVAFTAFALALGLGMQPLYTAVPPPIPISFTPVIAIGFVSSNQVCLSLASDIIDVWFKTGTATLNSPPGTTIPWS